MRLCQRLVEIGEDVVDMLDADRAAKVGYEAEEAFNRAFKRAFGLPPAKWRDLQ